MILIVSLVIISAGGIVRIIWATQQAQEITSRDLSAVTNVISDRSGAALSFNDWRLAEDNLKALKLINSVKFACMYKVDGALFASYQREPDKITHCPEYQDLPKAQKTFDNNSLKIMSNIQLSSDIIGSVFVNSDLSRIKSAQRDEIIFLASSMLISIALTLLIASWIQRFISKPIINMTSIAKKIASDNDHTLRANISDNDELGQLARSFNSMIDSLQKSHAEQQGIINSMLAGVITIDETGKVLSFNPSAETIFGYTANEVIDQNISLLMPAPYNENHTRYISNYLNSGVSQFIGRNRTLNAKKKNGETFPLHLSVAEIASNNNKKCFIGSCIDLTKEKQQEEQIRRTQKMDAIGELSGGIAHDYNNMLGVILGYADLLATNLAGDEKLSRYIGEIKNAGNRGSNLTKKLLTISKKSALEQQSINLNDVLVDNQQLLEKVLTARVALEINVDDNIWPIYVDKSELEDVLLNMSINAMHAIDKYGHVTISTYNNQIDQFDAQSLDVEPGKYVTLEIRDTGSGMSSSTKDKIFEPFFSTKGDKGTGLGLSQVYIFAKRNKGCITVDSAPGEGTSFRLFFPKHDNLNSIVKEKANNENNLSGNESLLIVDDERTLLELCSESLRLYGYKVYTANDSTTAMSILEKEKIDLVISDVIMPNTDGYELANFIQKNHPQVKVQLISGYDETSNIEKADFELKRKILHKPISSNELLTTIRRIFQ